MSLDGTSQDRTRFNYALLGFYVSCTVVGIAVTIAAAALIVFGDEPFSGSIATIAIIITLAASITTWLTLRAARGGS